MIIELTIVGLLSLATLLTIIIKRNKTNLTKFIFGLIISLLYLGFKFSFLVEYLDYYLLGALVYTAFLLLSLVPKKITKNITEYDYFELEKAYKEKDDDLEKLRQRYISTVSMIDEGIVFYENGFKDVFLSDKALEIFTGKKSLSLSEHALRVYEPDRQEYLNMIDRIGRKIPIFETKYRIYRENKIVWVLERGRFINVDEKKSCISVIKTLDFQIYNKSSYFEIDSLYNEEKLYPALKNLLSSHTPFSLVLFELSNIPEINKKAGREVGNLMMNDYLKFIRNNYAKEINRLFRVAGIKFAMIIDDETVYQELHKALIQSGSFIYNIKINVAGISETAKANFGIVKYTGSKTVDSEGLLKIAEKTLNEAIESTRRSYSIFGE